MIRSVSPQLQRLVPLILLLTSVQALTTQQTQFAQDKNSAEQSPQEVKSTKESKSAQATNSAQEIKSTQEIKITQEVKTKQEAQDTQDARQDDPIKLRAELVLLDAHVVDRKTREFIRALRPQDFELYEDNAKQRIEFFSQDKLPLSIVLLVDISPSVRPVIEKVREGALKALQTLRPEDEVALMAFAGWTELIQDFTKERQLILDKLAEALSKKGGGTRIHEAVAKAARQMRYATNPNSRRVIIVITDNQGSMDRYRDAISEEEVNHTVMESGATVCGVIVRSPVNVADAILFQTSQMQDKYKRTSVNPYAEQTGGEISGASKDEINARLGEMFAHLRSRYSLGYLSTNENYDGKFRRIRLALSPDARKRLGGDIAVRTRQGYYAVDRESEALLADDGTTSPAAPLSQPQSKLQTLGVDPAEATVTGAGEKTTNPADHKPAEPAIVQPTVPEPAVPIRPPDPFAHLVMLDVQAVNKKTGLVVNNLNKEDFELNDNGVKKEIVHFSRGELPLSVVLLVDVGGKTPYVMSALRRNVALWLRSLGTDDEVAVMGFGASTAVIQDFTKDRKLIAVALRDFAEIARQRGCGGGQDRTTAVFQAAEYMEGAANPMGRRVIIAVTDDSPRSYSVAESGATARVLLDSRTTVYAMVTKGPRPSRKRQVARAAAEGALYGLGNPVSIITRVLTSLGTSALMDAILKDRTFGQMIQNTGGTAIAIDGENAPERFTMLLGQIKSRYVVGIDSPLVSSDPLPPAATVTANGFRTLRVKLTPDGLKRHGELVLATSQGYYVRLTEESGTKRDE